MESKRERNWDAVRRMMMAMTAPQEKFTKAWTEWDRTHQGTEPKLSEFMYPPPNPTAPWEEQLRARRMRRQSKIPPHHQTALRAILGISDDEPLLPESVVNAYIVRRFLHDRAGLVLDLTIKELVEVVLMGNVPIGIDADDQCYFCL